MRSLAVADRDMGEKVFKALQNELETLQTSIKLQEVKMQDDFTEHETDLKQIEMNFKHHITFHEMDLEKVDTDKESEVEQNAKLHKEREEQIRRAHAFVDQQLSQGKENQERALQALSVNIALMKQKGKEFLQELTEKLEARKEAYVNMWTLRRRVELMEIEERKNRHIFTLNDHHRNAFAKTKMYYNQVTVNNLKIIRSLK
ncbi:MAG: hypothetical protein EZS28_045716, partial [Streblomastix strix]